MASPERPLVSFTLLGCNQEKFIREAISGALAQTYSPLEIILSDDCSTDRTFEIMQEIAASYTGPHKIVVTQTSKNLGCGGHVSAVMDMAQGDLVVRADGDDVSLPERTKVLTEAWLKASRPSGIGSGVIPINEQGKKLGIECQILSPPGHTGGVIAPPELIRLFLQEKPLGVVGCCGAWSKQSWNLFGKFSEGVQQEDTVLSFRAFLHGGLYTIDQQLVKYRTHQENATFSLGRKENERASLSTYKTQALRVAIGAKRRYAEFTTVSGDITTAKRKLGVDPQLLGDLESLIDRRIAALAVKKEWWRLGFFRRLRYLNYSPYAAWQQKIASLFGINGFALIRYLIVQSKALCSW